MGAAGTDPLTPSSPGPSLPKRARLLAAAELVPPGSRVADIGSGHGLLPRLLPESLQETLFSAGGPAE